MDSKMELNWGVGFGVILAVLAALGSLLGRLGGILRHLGAVLAHRRPSRRLWGGSWGRFWVILAHLGGVFRAQDRPKILPRRPKMPLRGLQDSQRFDFQQKVRKNEPFELGWDFPFDFCPSLSQKYTPDFRKNL